MKRRSLTIAAILVMAVILGTNLVVPSTAGTAAADGTPDLIILDIAPLPKNPSIGDTVTFTVTVKNQGNGGAAQSRLTIDIDEAQLAADYINSLEAGDTGVMIFTWTAQNGTHIFKATADANKQVNESNEENNVKTFTLSTLAPDLTIQSISWSPEDASLGDTISFDITVKNQGSGRSHTARVSFYINDSPRGYQDIPSLDPGSTITKSYSWVAGAGQHPIRAVADEENKIEESNENNNEATATFSTMAPDLIVDEVTWSPEDPSDNEYVTFTVTTTNRGNGRSNACQTAYYLEDTLIETDYTSELEPGCSVNTTFQSLVKADFPGILVVTDCHNVVAESSEFNNEYMINVLALQPDLVISDIIWEPSDASVGDAVTVRVTIRNQGSGKAMNSRLACYIGPDYQGYANVSELEAQQHANLNFEWTAQPGTRKISATADFDNKIAESKEDNNQGTAEIFIIPPDLVIKDISWSPKNPSLGDKVDFTIMIANDGGGKALSFHTGYYVDDNLINVDFIGQISSGENTTISFDWVAEPGIHTFRAVADENFTVNEGNEQNNEFAVEISPVIPDLAIEKITWSPQEITAGDVVNIAVTIKNQGTDRAFAFHNTYYVDDSVAGYQNAQEMEAGDEITQNILWTAAAGLHTIRIELDSDEQIIELDEENNIRSVSFPPPDLTLQNASISPAEAAVGQPVTITFTIQNRGKGPAENPSVSFYVNGEARDSLELPDMAPGDILTDSLTWVAEAGPCNVRVAADGINIVMESNETNNDKIISYGTLTADLVIEDIFWSQDNEANSDDITFNVVIRNDGTYTSERCRVAFYVDNAAAGEHEIEGIEPGTTFSELFQIVVESGSHTVNAIADIDETVDEIDETNNEKELSFSTITPDLLVEGISWAPKEPLAGDIVTFTVPVKNQGREEAQNINVVLSIDGTEVGRHDVLEIARGETVTKTFTWEALPGSHIISAAVDLDELVVESNEANNIEERTLALPDSIPTKPLPSQPQGGGILDDLWWLLYVTAFLFGGMAFYAVLKSSKRGSK